MMAAPTATQDEQPSEAPANPFSQNLPARALFTSLITGWVGTRRRGPAILVKQAVLTHLCDHLSLLTAEVSDLRLREASLREEHRKEKTRLKERIFALQDQFGLSPDILERGDYPYDPSPCPSPSPPPGGDTLATSDSENANSEFSSKSLSW